MTLNRLEQKKLLYYALQPALMPTHSMVEDHSMLPTHCYDGRA